MPIFSHVVFSVWFHTFKDRLADLSKKKNPSPEHRLSNHSLVTKLCGCDLDKVVDLSLITWSRIR